MKQTRMGKLALAGVFTSLALVLLLLTATPVATVGTAALAAVCGIPVVAACGRRAGLLHFVAVAVLAWLLVPAAEGKVLYTAFFGWYTVAKAWLEQKGLPRPAEWGIKVALCLVALSGAGVLWFFLLTPVLPDWAAWWMLPVGGVALVAVFFVYDRCLTGLVGTYIARLQPLLRKTFKL